MNSNWRNRPTTIDYISKDIDWIIGIDESGSPSLKQVQKAHRNGTEAVESERHFTVTAAAIKMENFGTARDMVMALKNKYWKDALFTYKGVEKRVCFHSREIRGKREAFNPDLIDYPSFITDLSQLMKEVPITLYAAHIDKVRHVSKYIYPDPSYGLCMTFVLERILRNMRDDQTCILVLEARGTQEDKELLDFIKGLIDFGTDYYGPKHFQRIKGVYFNPKWCAIADDKKSYWELELADLCAYPIQKYFVYGTKDKAFEVLLRKFCGYPFVKGKGMKSFP